MGRATGLIQLICRTAVRGGLIELDARRRTSSADQNPVSDEGCADRTATRAGGRSEFVAIPSRERSILPSPSMNPIHATRPRVAATASPANPPRASDIRRARCAARLKSIRGRGRSASIGAPAIVERTRRIVFAVPWAEAFRNGCDRRCASISNAVSSDTSPSSRSISNRSRASSGRLMSPLHFVLVDFECCKGMTLLRLVQFLAERHDGVVNA